MKTTRIALGFIQNLSEKKQRRLLKTGGFFVRHGVED